MEPDAENDERPPSHTPGDSALAALGTTLLEMTEDGVWAMNARHETVYVNRRLVELLGYGAPAELLGRTVESFMFDEDLAAHHERMQARRRGEGQRYEHRFRRADGSELRCRVSATPLRDAAGGFGGSIAVMTDISEQHRAAERMRVMAELLDHAPSSITVHDFEGSFLYANEMTFRLHGYTREEFLALRLHEIDVPESATLIEARMRALREQGTATFEVRHRCKDGSSLPLEVSVRLTTWMGRPALLSIASDLRERQRAAEELRRKSEELDRYFESSLDLFCITDTDGCFRRLNPQWERTLGYPLAELEGRRFLDLVHPDDLPATVARVVQFERQQSVLSFENRCRCRDGSYRWIEWRWLSQGKVIYAAARDVTERRQAEEQRRRLEQQLLHAQKMEAVGRLAGGLAHDFNNILTVVQSCSALALERLREDDPSREDLEQIRHAARRATGLTRQLLAFSRRQVLNPVTFDLNRLVVDVQKLLCRLLGEDILLQLDLAPELGAVHADPGQIEQVLVNLAVNARDAMPDGGHLTIATAGLELGSPPPPALATLPPGPYIRLTVEDDGCGMSEETLAHLFEPFFTTKVAGRGTGLGMPTVYGIVAQSGGGLAVRSAVGRGTTVEVYLPVAEDQPRDESDRPAAAESPPGGTETVLVAEDDEQVRNLAANVLRSAGYRVLLAADGRQALQLAAEHPDAIHLLLTDVVMPELGGRQLAERLIAARPALRVLFMSGHADDAAFHDGTGSSGVPFVSKPFGPTELRTRVRRILDADP
ncbi:MAG: PAS domain S-box protein [Deltaproteobacteria bacterium]|nr:PAS domain S-box protein [Deltaproteobacteria bacterium]